MKVALIPPISYLPIYGHSHFHLLLAHLLKRRAYADHYKKERLHGSYLVLDNSAHEKGIGEDAEMLMFEAMAVRAQEVVVPDVLFDCDRTIESAIAAHETWYEGRYTGMQDLDPSLMYVPQGNTVDEWKECFRSLVRIHNFCSKRHTLRRDFVLGLSKDYEMWPGGLKELIEKYVWPVRRELLIRDIHMHVHLLGWGRDLWKLNEIAQEYPWIRSTDSAKPFVYAINGIKLKPPKIPEYPGRSRTYFSTKELDEPLCTHNVLMFLKAAKGDL